MVKLAKPFPVSQASLQEKLKSMDGKRIEKKFFSSSNTLR